MHSNAIARIGAALARGSRAPDATARAAARAAVAVILAPCRGGSDALGVLLIERAARDGDPWSGHMALPGGRWSPEDADLLMTAVRETHEEVGLALDPASALGALADLTSHSNPKAPLVRPFVFGMGAAADPRLGPEVASAQWVALGDLCASAGRATVDISGEEREVPAFRAGGRVVWGMTQRVLAELLALGEPDGRAG